MRNNRFGKVFALSYLDLNPEPVLKDTGYPKKKTRTQYIFAFQKMDIRKELPKTTQMM